MTVEAVPDCEITHKSAIDRRMPWGGDQFAVIIKNDIQQSRDKDNWVGV